MAIQKEIWVRDIAENLFPNNDVIMMSVDDSEYLSNKTVHLPQSGSVPTVEKNRSSLPATSAQRTDTEVSYDVDEYTTDPVTIKATEEVEVSYDKRQNVLMDHVEQLRTSIADNLLHDWAPSATAQAAQQVRTSGTARAGYLATQSGNRKAIAKADFLAVQRIFNVQNIPQEGRIACIDANLYTDILNIDEFVTAEKIGRANLVDGAVGMLLGFQIMIRSNVVVYDDTADPVKKAVAAAAAADDNLACLFWHRRFVRRAFGTAQNGGIQVFERNNDPQFYGDILSAMVRAGGRPRYTNFRGVVALIESASA